MDDEGKTALPLRNGVVRGDKLEKEPFTSPRRGAGRGGGGGGGEGGGEGGTLINLGDN